MEKLIIFPLLISMSIAASAQYFDNEFTRYAIAMAGKIGHYKSIVVKKDGVIQYSTICDTVPDLEVWLLRSGLEPCAFGRIVKDTLLWYSQRNRFSHFEDYGLDTSQTVFSIAHLNAMGSGNQKVLYFDTCYKVSCTKTTIISEADYPEQSTSVFYFYNHRSIHIGQSASKYFGEITWDEDLLFPKSVTLFNESYKTTTHYHFYYSNKVLTKITYSVNGAKPYRTKQTWTYEFYK